MNVLIDIGGTKTRLAVSHKPEAFEEPSIIKTPPNFAEAIEEIVRTIAGMTEEEPIEHIALGAPGPFDQTGRQLAGSPNLSDWNGKPLVEKLEEALGTTVSMRNDADLVGLGEAHYGAGEGADIVAYLTVSTGVGGGRIVDGRIDVAAVSFEPGHQLIDPTRSLCTDCPGPTLEQHISGAAVEKRFGKRAETIAANDPLWQELAAWLAIGLNNTMVHWSPDIIVLGGAMIVGTPAISVEAVAQELASMEPIFAPPRIRKAELGDLGGLWGGLSLLQNQAA